MAFAKPDGGIGSAKTSKNWKGGTQVAGTTKYNFSDLAKTISSPDWKAYKAQNGLIGTAENLNAAAPYIPGTSQYPSYQPQGMSMYGGGGGGGRGGGGGGGGGAPKMTQEEMDWAARLLGGRPQQLQYQAYDAPDIQNYAPKAFDASMYDSLRTRLAGAGQADLATAAGATQNMRNYYAANQTNPYANMPQQQGGAELSYLQQLMGGQGVTDPSIMQGVAQGMGVANQGAANLWATLGANEGQYQANQRTANELTGQDVQNRIRAQIFGGNTGIDMQQGAAKSAYDQRIEDWARQDWQTQQQALQQEALMNWQRQNQVGDTNVSGQNDWRNNANTALLALMQGAIGSGLTLPDLQAMGLA